MTDEQKEVIDEPVVETKATPAPVIEQTVAPTYLPDENQISNIMMNTELLKQSMAMAEMMAEADVMVPKHFHGKRGDCYAVVLQAIQWRLNPFVVAQKTHLVNGTLGYEAQLVVAVLQSSGAIKGSFKYEYGEDQGHTTCRAGAILANDTELTWGEWINSGLVTTKNSPLWKTNERQQLAYLQSKNWARLYCPGAILGVYTDDELRDNPEFNRGGAQSKPAPAAATMEPYNAAEFEANYPSWKLRVQKGTNSAQSIISFLTGSNTFTDEQQARLEDLRNHEPIEGNQ